MAWNVFFKAKVKRAKRAKRAADSARQWSGKWVCGLPLSLSLSLSISLSTLLMKSAQWFHSKEKERKQKRGKKNSNFPFPFFFLFKMRPQGVLRRWINACSNALQKGKSAEREKKKVEHGLTLVNDFIHSSFSLFLSLSLFIFFLPSQIFFLLLRFSATGRTDRHKPNHVIPYVSGPLFIASIDIKLLFVCFFPPSFLLSIWTQWNSNRERNGN